MKIKKQTKKLKKEGEQLDLLSLEELETINAGGTNNTPSRNGIEDPHPW